MPTPDFSTDELVLALSQTIPSAAIEAALARTGKLERRRRKLPSALVLQLVIALGLLVDMARRQVLATLCPPSPQAPLPTKKSISRACRRVGARPMIHLFHSLARPLAAIQARGAHFLGRIPAQVKLSPAPGGRLQDGSYLCRIQPDPAARRSGAQPLVVRVIEYRIDGHGEVYRLATSLLAADASPALELAGLYHERWEVETFLDEVKTHQQGRPNGQHVAIHAQTPAGVVQEIYGLALAHRVVRTLMLAAATAHGLDPDRLSFKNALVIVRRHLPALAQARRKALVPLLRNCCSRSAGSACRRASRTAISAG